MIEGRSHRTTVRGRVVPFTWDTETCAGYVRLPDGHVSFGASDLNAARRKVRRIWTVAVTGL